MKSRYLGEQNSESSEHEESLPAPRTLPDDSNSSVGSTSSVDSSSFVDSTSSIDSNSSVDLTLSVDSTLSVGSISSVGSNSSVDSTSMVGSTSSVNSTSADALAVSSTSRKFEVNVADITSSTSSARVGDLTSPMPSTLSMSPTSPIQMPPDHTIPPVPSTSRDIQENYNDFRVEVARRLSFQNWPVSFIDPASLSAAGLYYTGEMDIVRCFECQLEISQWSEDHSPMQIHRMRSPECKFVRNEDCNNVSIGADPEEVLRTEQRHSNISCPYGLLYTKSFDFNDYQFLTRARNPSAFELSRLGLTKFKTPENLNYTSYESRLNSFATWPRYIKQTREELAIAGFYYTGIEDVTACYHCGIHIGNWEIEEDVWEQHAQLSPNCCYLLTVQGTKYVNNVTGQKLYATFEEVPTETTAENHERFHSESNQNVKHHRSNMTFAEKLAALEQENKKLIDSRLCKVCTKQEASITFLPCRHLVTCEHCYHDFTQCLICGIEIKALSRAYFT